MIIHDCEQGSNEWMLARAGRPTASEFSKIITPATGKYLASARPYQLRLLVEKMLRIMPEDISNLPHVAHGNALEPTAVAAYEFERQVTTKKIGFITTDDGRYGASPDRLLVEINGGLEIKCPSPAVHLGYWADGFGTEYHCQRQGQMLVAELDFIDMFSYCPQLPSRTERFGRDEEFLTKMRDCLDRFCDEMGQLEERLRGTGFFDEVVQSDEVWWEDYLTNLEQRGEILDAG